MPLKLLLHILEKLLRAIVCENFMKFGPKTPWKIEFDLKNFNIDFLVT